MKSTRFASGTMLAVIFTLFAGPTTVQLFAQGGTWTTKAPMPTARAHLSTSVVNGIIYAIGGINGSGIVATVEAYDPATNAWTTKASMPTARYGLGTGVVNGIIYAIGGNDGKCHPGNWECGSVPTVEAYDPASNTWTTKASMPTERWLMGTSVVNGVIYAVDGYNGLVLDTVEAYDPTSDTWTPVHRWGASRRFGLSTSVVNGVIYAVGGWDGGGGWVGIVEAYDPASDIWTGKTSMPTERAGLATSVVNENIYAVGGSGVSGGASGAVETYDPATDTWTTKASMPTPRIYLGTSVVSGVIYAMGGVTDFGYVGTNEAFTPTGTNHPPVANAGPDQTVEGTSHSGTMVTLNGSASSDPDAGDTLTYEWKDELGSVVGTSATDSLILQLGAHTFTLTVNDGKGGTATDTVVITVRDTTPPELTLAKTTYSVILPVGQTTATLSVLTESGASATDICDPNPVLTPAGSASYPVGTTQVMIKATDSSGNFSQKAFSVEVLTAAQAIQSLTTLVGSYNLQQGITNSLDAKLQNAQAALLAANAGQRQDAQNKILAFINAVEAQRGNQLTSAQADSLIAGATRVLAVL